MTKKRALITGIGGQDGSYLAEYLLSKDYEVFGIVRRHSVAENQDSRLRSLNGYITTWYGDLLDIPSLNTLILSTSKKKIEQCVGYFRKK